MDINNSCINCFLSLDMPPSATAQVVHSAGRRFIVSPVPEARLKQETFPSSPSHSPSPLVETGEDCMRACISFMVHVRALILASINKYLGVAMGNGYAFVIGSLHISH